MCWGRNEATWGYACGDGKTDVTKKSNPVWVKTSVDGPDGPHLQGVVRELYVGQFHSCVLFEDDLDRLVCWGLQTMGIANPNVDPATTTNDGVARFMAKEITYFKDRGKRVKSLGLGADHTCALLTTGTVECWGVNNWGQLGSGFLDNYFTSEDPAHCGANSSVRTSSVANIGTNGNPFARVLAVSWYHTCATMHDFTIRCWGKNYVGQLGDHQRVTTFPQTVGREPVTVILSKGPPEVNFTAFDTRGACGCCDDRMKAMNLITDCKA